MRLIDPIELKKSIAISEILKNGKTLEQIIDSQPSAQPEPKKGQWGFFGYNMFKCTSCGVVYTVDQLESLRNLKTDPEFPDYCPCCGSFNKSI